MFLGRANRFGPRASNVFFLLESIVHVLAKTDLFPAQCVFWCGQKMRCGHVGDGRRQPGGGRHVVLKS
jgi:hypothetical protein